MRPDREVGDSHRDRERLHAVEAIDHLGQRDGGEFDIDGVLAKAAGQVWSGGVSDRSTAFTLCVR